jgi:hypothetical protein
VIVVECAHAGAADAADAGGHVGEVRIVRHRVHGGVEIACKLGFDMTLEQGDHRALLGGKDVSIHGWLLCGRGRAGLSEKHAPLEPRVRL